MRKRRWPGIWSAYFSYATALAAVFAVLFLINFVPELFRTPLPVLLHRAILVAPLLVFAPLAGAAAMVAIPFLWFWPWMRNRKPGGPEGPQNVP
jgi:hypothetical protein